MLCLLLMTCGGCGIGYALYVHIDYDTSSAWRSLGSPPQPIVRIQAADFYTVYVQTINGQLFSCYRASRFDQQCWTAIEAIPLVETGGCSGIQPTIAPPPSAAVRQRLDTDWCWRFGRSQYSYVLLTDGTIMQWVYDDYHASIAPTMERDFKRFIILGTLGGFLIGMIFIGLIRHKRHR